MAKNREEPPCAAPVPHGSAPVDARNLREHCAAHLCATNMGTEEAADSARGQVDRGNSATRHPDRRLWIATARADSPKSSVLWACWATYVMSCRSVRRSSLHSPSVF